MGHMGSQFPNQGLNPCPMQGDHRALTAGPSGKSQKRCISDKSSLRAQAPCGAPLQWQVMESESEHNRCGSAFEATKEGDVAFGGWALETQFGITSR